MIYILNFLLFLKEHSWSFIMIAYIAIFVILLRKNIVSTYGLAKIGLILLVITMILSIFGLDEFAGIAAQFVFVSFVLSFVSQFGAFINNEKN